MEKDLGTPLPNWKIPCRPKKEFITGNYCQLEPLNVAQHANDLWHAYTGDNKAHIWDYLPYGPFNNCSEFEDFLKTRAQSNEDIFYAIVLCESQQAVGHIAYSRIQPNAGSIEIAHVCFSPLLQKTTAATQAIYLLIDHCFSLGYRRCEWKCNSLNQASKNAAQRLGFTYEGRFRQAVVVKGRNRDTDWYSIIDGEWPALKTAFQQWLDPSNFKELQQKKNLSFFIRQLT